MEEWRRCYETDDYEVSNLGEIRNTKTGRILKTYIDDQGREIVSIKIDGRNYTRRVHRLVAEAFYGADCEGLEIYHRDRNKLNNRLSNLALGTRSEVIAHTYKLGRSPANQKRIRCIETGKEYESIRECSKAVGLCESTISKCLNYSFNHNRKGLHFEVID